MEMLQNSLTIKYLCHVIYTKGWTQA